MILFMILIAVFVLYWRTLDYKYIIDDIVRRWEYLYVVPEMSPPPDFFDRAPHPWRHWFLIFTHALNIWLIHSMWGWPAALIFAFHPVNVTCTAWITGGYYSVTVFLSLATMFFLQIYPDAVGGILGVLFYTAALGSTIVSVGLPFLYLFFFSKYGLLLLLPLALYIFGKRFNTGYKIRDLGKKDKFVWRKIALVPKVSAHYIKLAFWPARLSFFKQYGWSYTNKKETQPIYLSFNQEFYEAVMIIGLFTYIGWQYSPIGTMLFLFGISPFSQYKLLGQFVAERYMYFPLVGFSIVLGAILQHHPLILTAVITLYIIKANQYIPAFSQIDELYKYGIKEHPDCFANYCNLAERYLHMNELRKGSALLYYIVNRVDPDSFLAHTNLAAYWVAVKNFNQALMHTEMGLKTAGEGGIIKKVLTSQRDSIIQILTRVMEIRKKSRKGKI